MTVMAATAWPTNAHLIEACAELGYLRKEWLTLDATYGYGTFWKRWRPDELVGVDINPAKCCFGESIDFTKLPFMDDQFDVVVLDPPYKLNGTPSGGRPGDMDERYGVDVSTRRWQDRMDLIYRGLTECERVLKKGGNLLLKCQDQVCSGQIRWQTHEFTRHAETLGLRLRDRFDFLNHPRPQPAGPQVHARRNYSTLLVFTHGTVRR